MVITFLLIYLKDPLFIWYYMISRKLRLTNQQLKDKTGEVENHDVNFECEASFSCLCHYAFKLDTFGVPAFSFINNETISVIIMLKYFNKVNLMLLI